MSSHALSESEMVAKIERFRFDKAPDIVEISERVFIRAAHIAALAADLLKSVTS